MDRLFIRTRWLVRLCLASLLAWAAASSAIAADRDTSVHRLPSMAEDGIRPYRNRPAKREIPASPHVEAIPSTHPPAATGPSATDQREIAIISEQADRHVRYGLSMAARGGLFTARTEFIRALRLIAETLDARPGDTGHAAALARGLRALDEAEDFMPTGSRLEAEIDMATVLSGHRTQLTTGADAAPRTPREALDHYYVVAYQQLAYACGNVPVGSASLYGLGKVQTALAATRPEDRRMREFRAMVMHQASLQVDARNPLAANELGVLLVRYGRLGPARRLLEQSVQILPRPVVWHNLAVVYARSGESELATEARGRLTQSARPVPIHGKPQVEWLDNKAFARTAGPVSSPNRITR